MTKLYDATNWPKMGLDETTYPFIGAVDAAPKIGKVLDVAGQMRDLLYDILLNNANVDYDDAGFALIATAVSQTLAEAADVDHNIVARDQESKAGIFTVNIPTYAESTEEQRRNRVMPDITWEALLCGAVHQVKTKGVLRASL